MSKNPAREMLEKALLVLEAQRELFIKEGKPFLGYERKLNSTAILALEEVMTIFPEEDNRERSPED